ncbi:hypothetical protein [Lysinibacillus sp. RC79]|uniref:hypothetical protein n=1 Tax=Lysinibacillus sp. RC79 TaxID=3156296 RepID=UPI003517EE60
MLYADAMASAIVAYFIFRIALELIKPSVDGLMEKSVDQDLLDGYEATIHEFYQVQRIDKILCKGTRSL